MANHFDIENFNADGKSTAIPGKGDVTFFDEVGNCLVLEREPDGHRVITNFREGLKYRFSAGQVKLAKGKEGNWLTADDGKDCQMQSAKLVGFLEGNIEKGIASAELVAAILQAVNPVYEFESRNHVQADPSDAQIHLNRHPQDIVIPECFTVRESFGERFYIGAECKGPSYGCWSYELSCPKMRAGQSADGLSNCQRSRMDHTNIR
ncbi:MAG: hypothetical protein FWE53_05360 [Firmicutes bacterium]|nr:hypothetical protein [Bacillota bacterium]